MTMTNPVSLLVGDELKDLLNTYEVVGTKYENTHSQYPSHYLTKCVSGPNFSRETWVRNYDLQHYLPGGKHYGKEKETK